MKKKLFIAGFTLVIICILIFLTSIVYVLTHAFIEDAKQSDAIVALAEGTTKEGLPCTIARTEHAIELYKKGLAPIIVFAGGKLPVDYAVEAEVMKQIALVKHVPEKDILVEGKSHNTYEDIHFSKQILDEHNLRTIILVADPFQETRAALVARKEGISYTLSPAVKSSCTQEFPKNLTLLIHESVGILYYKLLGRW